MKTKNENIQQLWKEVGGQESITLTKYQFAMIFDYGYEYHKKSIDQNPNIETLSLADLHVLEKELAELVDNCTLPDKGLDNLDANGIKYNKKLTKVSLEIERRVKELI